MFLYCQQSHQSRLTQCGITSSTLLHTRCATTSSGIPVDRRPRQRATERSYATSMHSTHQPGSMPDYTQVDPYRLLEDDLCNVYDDIRQVGKLFNLIIDFYCSRSSLILIGSRKILLLCFCWDHAINKLMKKNHESMIYRLFFSVRHTVGKQSRFQENPLIRTYIFINTIQVSLMNPLVDGEPFKCEYLFVELKFHIRNIRISLGYLS